MICTTSIGPGATNLVTAAAVAHVNRLPVLLLPGDVYASHRPDPVLQQVEDFNDAGVTANDACARSRVLRSHRAPGAVIESLPLALATMLDPATCGPATLAFCQDVQAEAFEYPEAFFARRLWQVPRVAPPGAAVDALARRCASARVRC
jgi:3D-(3,5/4)-trihydroxycyclohexane-1,2-dione acylhydrolase (decyclizing)